ncbi:CoA transferase [Bradyrhizobium sp. Pha-3]|uniref:CoA transferase n=1 Tax=Bradyrhizobium sp. Pha-3 TaxID=208375 RepID=UPI0035D3F338
MTRDNAPTAVLQDIKPLSGTVILEVGNAKSPACLRVATSFAGKIMSELGAKIVKLEPSGGDPVRHFPPFLATGPDGKRSALFKFLNTGKTTLSMPSDAVAVRSAVESLLGAGVDGVLLEEDSELKAVLARRSLALVEIAGWPAGTPALGKLSEFTALASGGLLDMIGEPDRKPLRLGGHQASYSAGLSVFTALMALLAERDAGRHPAPARVSLIETAMWVNWKAIAGIDEKGKSPTRQGNQSEFQVVRCLDGWIAVVFSVTQFEGLRDLVNSQALRHAKFATREGRLKHMGELYRYLEPWFAVRTRAEVYHEAQTRGVPLGPVCTSAELIADPQNVARGFIVPLADVSVSDARAPRLPVLWSRCVGTPTSKPREEAVL